MNKELYTKELADEICDTIACHSEGLIALCAKNKNWPSRKTIYCWMRKYPEFRSEYMKAKEFQVQILVDEIIDIADDTSKDTVIKTGKYGNEAVVCNSEWVNRSRLRIETRKWQAGKLMPKTYGDVKEEKGSNSDTLMEKLIDKL